MSEFEYQEMTREHAYDVTQQIHAGLQMICTLHNLAGPSLLSLTLDLVIDMLGDISPEATAALLEDHARVRRGESDGVDLEVRREAFMILMAEDQRINGATMQ